MCNSAYALHIHLGNVLARNVISNAEFFLMHLLGNDCRKSEEGNSAMDGPKPVLRKEEGWAMG